MNITTRTLAITTLLISSICFSSFAHESNNKEGDNLENNSPEFLQSFDLAISNLVNNDFQLGLKSPTLGSMSDNEFAELVKEIRLEKPIDKLSTGDSNVKYDVILQPGHHGRKKGIVGTEGDLVSERALATYVVRNVANKLEEKEYSVLIISADKYLRDDPKTEKYEGLKTGIFLSIHADGSTTPCKSGPSLGYANKEFIFASHTLGWGLAQALGYNYKDFMKDNFTANLSKYYMFRKINSSVFEGIIELGELTCNSEEKQLVENIDAVANNLAHAIEFISQAGREN